MARKLLDLARDKIELLFNKIDDNFEELYTDKSQKDNEIQSLSKSLPLSGPTDPTAATEAKVGQIYTNVVTGNQFTCVSITEEDDLPTYNWLPSNSGLLAQINDNFENLTSKDTQQDAEIQLLNKTLPLSGLTDPTSSTEAKVGQIYTNVVSGNQFTCVSITKKNDLNAYHWLPSNSEILRIIQDALAGKVDWSRFSNPNLLDDWYFMDPIDQRNGRIVYAGTTYYTTSELTTIAGTTTAAMTAQYINSTYGTINISGTTYYVAAADVVRGYTSLYDMYSIDRWVIQSNINLILTSQYITLSKKYIPNYAYTGFYQLLEQPLSGTLTFSALLCGSGDMQLHFSYTDDTYTNKIITLENMWNVFSFTITTNKPIKLVSVLLNGTANSCDILATKLEFGDHQTLAHQDASGNWVLNDPPPNKALELAKCQRFQIVMNAITAGAQFGIGVARSESYAVIQCHLSETLRAKPTLVRSGSFYLQNAGQLLPVTALSTDETSSSIIGLRADVASGLATGSSYVLRTSNDANAQIILDANL